VARSPGAEIKKEYIMGSLMTMEGRIGRQNYIVMSAIITVAAFAISFVIGLLAGLVGISEDASGGIGFIVGLAFSVVQAFIVVRRLHDLGKPGWHYWLFFVPFYNLYLSLVLTFTKGATGSNGYGADPV
jgi:uncharacterized membrane protein YhaH (DUF805 family)